MQQRAIDCIIEHITVGTLISKVNMNELETVQASVKTLFSPSLHCYNRSNYWFLW